MVVGPAFLFLVAFVVSLAATGAAKRLAGRLGLMDAPGHRKVHTAITPRNGGIGIFWGIALPILAGVAVLSFVPLGAWPHRYAGTGHLHDVSVLGVPIPDALAVHLPGMVSHRGLLLLLLACTAGVHALGLLDDRKAMAPLPKLLGQFLCAAGLVVGGELLQRGGFRTLTFLDDAFPGGVALSMLLSAVWLVTLTNAFNFLDNMDGLSAGVAFLCALMFLVAAVRNEQFFIAGLLLIFMGSTLGFLCYNYPPASIFMGDGGSMVLGFFLAALTIRTTYYTEAGPAPTRWWAVFMPLIVCQVPLYDLLVVSVIRLLRGRSPMTGDTNHFSHRLTRHGFSKRGAVLVIYAVTLASGLGAPLLARADGTEALLVALQCLAMLIVIGILERVGEHTT